VFGGDTVGIIPAVGFIVAVRIGFATGVTGPHAASRTIRTVKK